MQMTPSMTFNQSYGCKEIDLILNKYGNGSYNYLSAWGSTGALSAKHAPVIVCGRKLTNDADWASEI